jgi:predicted RNA-binding Zn-ribbon protein involved in translation (DUF1610 family)
MLKKMVKKCMYCGIELEDSFVVDFCKKCGTNVWGEKMFNTIVKNMEEARDSGDLCHANNTCELPSNTDSPGQEIGF